MHAVAVEALDFQEGPAGEAVDARVRSGEPRQVGTHCDAICSNTRRSAQRSVPGDSSEPENLTMTWKGWAPRIYAVLKLGMKNESP